MADQTSPCLGIVGGIGPESTIIYYRSVLAAYASSHGTGHAPSVLINSIDVTKLLALAADDLTALANYLAAEIERLNRAGASLVLMAANTPHIVFDEVAARSSIPLVSIVEATCDEVKARGLIGTRFTMSGGFYQRVAVTHGIEMVLPAEDEQIYVHEKYSTELLRDVFAPRTRDGLLRVIDRMVERERIEGVMLGGTELPLILTEPSASGIPLLDTTQIHADAAVRRLWPSTGHTT